MFYPDGPSHLGGAEERRKQGWTWVRCFHGTSTTCRLCALHQVPMLDDLGRLAHRVPFDCVVSVDGAARKMLLPAHHQYCDECLTKLWGVPTDLEDDQDIGDERDVDFATERATQCSK